MESRSLSFVIAATGGRCAAGPAETVVQRVCTDSRKVQPGDLFFALSGPNFDAHDYLAEVAGKGACAVVIAADRAGRAGGLAPSVAQIVVDDPRRALGRLASAYRKDFPIPIVVVGGSNGKTTTKELLASILRQRFCTLWSQASFNNDIGVPLTLLNLERRHEAAVLEVGTNHPGELAPLLRMVQPRHAVLTNIGREHLEFFGDLAGVAQEEGELAEFLQEDGQLFINGDSEWTPTIVRRCRAGVVRAGFGAGNDWRATAVRVEEGGVSFTVEAPRVQFSGEYRLRLLGRHQVPNALLALAAGTELGVTPEQARAGLAECAPPALRLQIWESNRVRVLDDCYNANADSMLAALQTLHDLPCAGRRVAVLGEMAELGEHAVEAHREVGGRCAELGVNRLVAVGRFARETINAARSAGLSDAIECADVAIASQTVRELVQPGDTVLVKGSRAAGLEEVGRALRSGS